MFLVLVYLMCLINNSADATYTGNIIHDYSDLGGKPYTISWDSRSIRMNDLPVILLSGSIHYTRSTPEMWPILFKEARANGLNTIESYVFWNYHANEQDAPYNYSGNGNVTLFLSLAKEYNLFVIWRFGPYICAEWPDGGLPQWLHKIPDMKFRQYNQAWIDAVTKWGEDHFRVINPFLAKHGGPIIMSQIENEYGGKDMDYFAWMTKFTQNVAPSIAWVMCGHVVHVANGTIHTGNGCPGPQNFGQHTVPGVPGDPAMYTEDEQWFDLWGMPQTERLPEDVAYGVGSYIVTGGSMHNYYMWHGGNHYGNWSVSAKKWSDTLNGPRSDTNTVRYANSAPLHSDSTRNEPRWSLLQELHMLIRTNAEVMLTTKATKTALRCLPKTPNKCSGGSQYIIAYGNGTAQAIFFILNTNKFRNYTVIAQFGSESSSITIPGQTILAYNNLGKLLYNSSALPNTVNAPIVPFVTHLQWTSWNDSIPEKISIDLVATKRWYKTNFNLPQSLLHAVRQGESAILLDMNGMASGMIFINGIQITTYNLAIANCSEPRPDRCGAQPIGSDGKPTPDGGCKQPSQQYYHIPPEMFQSSQAQTLLIYETNSTFCCGLHTGCHACGQIDINPDKVRVCSRATQYHQRHTTTYLKL